MMQKSEAKMWVSVAKRRWAWYGCGKDGLQIGKNVVGYNKDVDKDETDGTGAAKKGLGSDECDKFRVSGTKMGISMRTKRTV